MFILQYATKKALHFVKLNEARMATRTHTNTHVSIVVLFEYSWIDTSFIKAV
jgi:hypothetical protein